MKKDDQIINHAIKAQWFYRKGHVSAFSNFCDNFKYLILLSFLILITKFYPTIYIPLI
jgi:hypothetical protein